MAMWNKIHCYKLTNTSGKLFNFKNREKISLWYKHGRQKLKVRGNKRFYTKVGTTYMGIERVNIQPMMKYKNDRTVKLEDKLNTEDDSHIGCFVDCDLKHLGKRKKNKETPALSRK